MNEPPRQASARLLFFQDLACVCDHLLFHVQGISPFEAGPEKIEVTSNYQKPSTFPTLRMHKSKNKSIKYSRHHCREEFEHIQRFILVGDATPFTRINSSTLQDLVNQWQLGAFASLPPTEWRLGWPAVVELTWSYHEIDWLSLYSSSNAKFP